MTSREPGFVKLNLKQNTDYIIALIVLCCSAVFIYQSIRIFLHSDLPHEKPSQAKNVKMMLGVAFVFSGIGLFLFIAALQGLLRRWTILFDNSRRTILIYRGLCFFPNTTEYAYDNFNQIEIIKKVLESHHSSSIRRNTIEYTEKRQYYFLVLSNSGAIRGDLELGAGGKKYKKVKQLAENIAETTGYKIVDKV